MRPFLGVCAEAFIAVDAEGRVRDANRIFQEQFGYSRDELLKLSLAEIEDNQTPDAVHRGLSRIAATGHQRCRTQLRHRDGSLHSVEITATAVQTDKDWFYLMFISDLSGGKLVDRNAVERELTDLFVRSSSRAEYLAGVVSLISRWCDCSCMGIRVLDWSGNIPYAAFKGFDQVFWEKENWLSVKKDQCLCPRVIMQKPDEPDMPGMTPGGSFICNHAIEFGQSLKPEQRPRYRGNCWKSGYASLAIIPLRHQGDPLGGIQLADERPGAISREKVEILESLTPLISVAIKHYNTEEELRQNYDAQMVTSLLARLSLENLSPEELAGRALDVILSIPWLPHDEAAAGSIFLTDRESGRLEMVAQEGISAETRRACASIQPGDCLCGLAGAKKEIVFTDGTDRIESMRCHDPSPHGHYCVPILTESRETLGVINVHVREGHHPSEREEQALTSIANTLSIGIQRKQAEQSLKLRTAQAESLVRSAGRLNTKLDMARVLRAVCEEAAQALGAPAASVALLHEGSGELRYVEAVGLPFDFCQQMQPEPFPFSDAKTGAGPHGFVTDLRRQRKPVNDDIYRDLDLGACATAVLRQAGQPIGTLNIYCAASDRCFQDEDLALLQGIADQAALAINNARLFSDASTRLSHIVSLRAIDMAIAASMDLRVILSVVLDQVAHQLQADAVDILLLNPQTQTLEYSTGRGFRSEALKHTHLQLGQGYGGRVALERNIISIPDMKIEDSLYQKSPQLNLEDFVAYHGAPLVAKGQVKGVLEVFHRRHFEPDTGWLEFLEAFAGQAAIAIDNATLFSDLQQSNTELSLAYDATLEGWSRALDLRDNETEGHTQRVTEMTMRLSRNMGIGEHELVHVRRGALLHDIGKMGIPDGILLKPGPLTPEEWEVMRRHPVYALELLIPITYLRQALDIPFCHHEKWDGSGYPRGIKGEQIPLTARIFSIVDVWDALASDRPYRESWPSERIIDYIKAESGSHFDPQVVEAFLDMLAEMERYRQDSPTEPAGEEKDG